MRNRGTCNDTLANHCRPLARAMCVSVLTVITPLFFPSAYAADTRSVAAQEGNRVLSSRAKALTTERWNDSSAERGVALLSDVSETPVSRAAAMQVLQGNRRKLPLDQMRLLLAETTRLAKDPSVDATNAASALNVLGNIALTMREQGHISDIESKQEAEFLIATATDSRRTALHRASAITALGVLKIPEANGTLREMLTNSATRDVPEIARPACLSLMRIDGERAIPDLANVLKKTTDARVFGTAAFALGQLKKSECIVALVQNLGRFPDAGACDAALVDMEDVINGVLRNPQDENLTAAIQATRHLWREGQREVCAPLLRNLVTAGPLEARKAAAERLMESADCLDFESEKRELTLLTKAIGDQPELRQHQERIQHRLSAGLATPTENPVQIPTVLKGEDRK